MMEQTPPSSMPSVIKEEPVQSSPSRRQRAAAKASANNTVASSSAASTTGTPHVDSPQQNNQPQVANNSHPRSQVSDSRLRRSEAPTLASSRVHPPRPNSVVGTETVGASDVRLQEIRPRLPEAPIISPDDAQQTSFTDSFVSNGLPLKDIDEKVTAFNNVLGELQHLGIQHVASLPELVLVGDQSAGKSSLMSAIAGLSLPRSGGTCTRCPIHIRLSKRPRWSCQIRLQLNYYYDAPQDTEIETSDVCDECPFPPWFEQTCEVKEFMTIDDKNDTGLIEKALSWAQIAILNPSTDYRRFIPGSGDFARNVDTSAVLPMEAKFSPNVIALEIQGPGLADLSFYDLPGLIVNTSDGEDEYLIKVVENLTKQYIEHQKAIIIWAVPMTADPQTSSTFTVIRKANALNRCIGVMTKADLLPPGSGSHTQWLEMLEGKRHKVKLGYFITSRRTIGTGPINLEIEHKAEEAFFNRFSSDKVWPREFHRHEDRCGVERLKRYLIELLSKSFRKSLPELQMKLKSRLQIIKQELTQLPELPPNPEAVIRTNLARFEENLTQQMQSQDFAAKWARIADKFRANILFLKPKYKLKVGAPASDNATDDLEIVSSRSLGQSPASGVKRQASVDHYADALPASQRRRGANGAIKTEEHPIGLPITPSRRGGAATTNLATPTRRKRTGATRPGGPSMTLEDVRELIRRCSKPGMPNTVPDEVKVRLCMTAVQHWDEPLEGLLENSIALLQNKLLSILGQSLGSLCNRQVFKKATSVIDGFCREKRKELGAQLIRLYKIESFQLYTLDNETCLRHEHAERRVLGHIRHHSRWQAHQDKLDDVDYPKPASWDHLTEEQRAQEEARMAKEGAKLGPDPYETELGVAAYVRGYYLTAAWRFIDTVCLNFTSALFPEVAPSMIQLMNAHLGISDSTAEESIWKDMMEEDEEVANRRHVLQTQEKTFEDALRKIERLGIDSHSTSGADIIDSDDEDVTFGGREASVVDLSMSDVE
ncbi:uncharacterized protein E0L32_005853 [Thyridium curvatum]|uniref:Uncharacterized protein n=1 Tax=Thyridium curvatum TaxID=1093900 RepID=A0A507BAN8_9PEZI|nr:uncharacterized protein E0L32_005853 [Thyridium curvatum]TPX13650.1 hypothetical protein E0L32_005853 [Thyridium curvatum]